MYTFSNSDYQNLAQRVAERINSQSVTNIDIEFENSDESADISLKAAVVPIFNTDELQKISPIWWEVTTTTMEGEAINDFDFATLNDYIY